jgi:hypothetical protein
VAVAEESTTTVNWSGLAAAEPAETTVKVSAAEGLAFAVRVPAPVAPTAQSRARAVPTLARNMTTP